MSRRLPFVAAILGSLSLVLQTPAARAATWDVPGDAPTIQAGIDLAAVGDTVLVAPGTYTGNGNRDLSLIKDVVVRSSAGPDVTVIDCEGELGHRGFFLEGPESDGIVVEGFTIQHGSQYGGIAISGGAILCWSPCRPTIRNCVLVCNAVGTPPCSGPRSPGEHERPREWHQPWRCNIQSRSMPSGGPRPRVNVYIETTAINHLLRKSHLAVRRRLLRSSRLRPIVGAMAVAELAATGNRSRRVQLLTVARDLATHGKLVADRPDVVQATIDGFRTGDRRRVWRGVSQRAMKRLLSLAESVDDDDREAARSGNLAIDATVDKGVDRLLAAGMVPKDEREWVQAASEDPEPARRFLRGLTTVPEPLVNPLAGAIAKDEPYVRPLRAAMLSTLAGFGMRRLLPPSDGDPVSGVDLAHGLYLAGCDVFVTEDRDQQRLARIVADYLGHHPRVSRVSEIAGL